MFSRLDTNFDLQLDQSEIKSLYLDRNEPCSDAFFKSCDVHIDKVLTSTEWCTCFQRYTGTQQEDPVMNSEFKATFVQCDCCTQPTPTKQPFD